jgi:hypothetical protein
MAKKTVSFQIPLTCPTVLLPGGQHYHELTVAQLQVILTFLKQTDLQKEHTDAQHIKAFLDAWYTLPGILSAYEISEIFRKRCRIIGIKLFAGQRASHRYEHAYVRRWSPQPGAVLSILTDHDFDQVDKRALRRWADYDLFKE